MCSFCFWVIDKALLLQIHFLVSVSYTHLDVYKRQVQHLDIADELAHGQLIEGTDHAGCAIHLLAELLQPCLLYTSRCV